MTGTAQALHVVIVISTTLCQRLDVIALCGQRGTSMGLALNTQGIGREQGSTLSLQTPTSHTLGGSGLLGPNGCRMLGATAGAITHQDTATRMATRFRCCFGHWE